MTASSSPSHGRNGLKIIIIGGGLCGLATSVSSSLAGHQVTVFETAEKLQEIGAGLQITPNGNRLLQRWGLWEPLASAAARPSRLTIHRFDGRILAERRHYDAEMENKYNFPIWCLHRADLQSALAQRASGLGVDIRLGCQVREVDFENSTITLLKGETVAGDLIIAADGLWSRVRDQFCGLDTPPKPTGDLAYRVTLQTKDIKDPEVLDLVAMPALNIWIGPEMHAVGYNVRGGALFNMVLLVPDNLPQGVRRQQGNTAELRKLFEGWDPILTKLISKIDKTEKWKLMHHPPLTRLTADSGRFIMAGDSCHPMLPYFAQGANSSFEDAAVLGALLSEVSSREDLRKIAPIYENLRRERVTRIHEETFVHRDHFHLVDGPEQILRDELFARSFTSDSWTHPKIQPWLFSYDAYQDAQKAYRLSEAPDSFFNNTCRESL